MNTNVIEPTTAIGVDTEKMEGDITTKYTFRKLNSTDTFLMFKIIGKIGINDFAKCFEQSNVRDLITNTKNTEGATAMAGISVILDVASVVISNLPKCEKEIYELLSNVSNLTVDEIKALDFVTFTEMVIEFIKKEEFKDFFKVVLKSFKPVN